MNSSAVREQIENLLSETDLIETISYIAAYKEISRLPHSKKSEKFNFVQNYPLISYLVGLGIKQEYKEKTLPDETTITILLSLLEKYFEEQLIPKRDYEAYQEFFWLKALEELRQMRYSDEMDRHLVKMNKILRQIVKNDPTFKRKLDDKLFNDIRLRLAATIKMQEDEGSMITPINFYSKFNDPDFVIDGIITYYTAINSFAETKHISKNDKHEFKKLILLVSEDIPILDDMVIPIRKFEEEGKIMASGVQNFFPNYHLLSESQIASMHDRIIFDFCLGYQFLYPKEWNKVKEKILIKNQDDEKKSLGKWFENEKNILLEFSNSYYTEKLVQNSQS